MENILIIVNFVTYTKEGAYFNLVFEDCMEEKYLKIKFKPHNPDMIFSKDRIDLMSIKDERYGGSDATFRRTWINFNYGWF